VQQEKPLGPGVLPYRRGKRNRGNYQSKGEVGEKIGCRSNIDNKRGEYCLKSEGTGTGKENENVRTGWVNGPEKFSEEGVKSLV